MNRPARAGVRLVLASALATMILAGCSQQQAADSPQIQDKRFTLNPDQVPVTVDLLTGTLGDMAVTERVEEGSGRVVYGPTFRAALKLKNTSEDQSVRLIAGEIRYLDADGKPIALAEGQGTTTFTFYSYQTERLDPGMETSQSLDLPFPVAAVEKETISDIRLELTYVTLPYQEASATFPVSLQG